MRIFRGLLLTLPIVALAAAGCGKKDDGKNEEPAPEQASGDESAGVGEAPPTDEPAADDGDDSAGGAAVADGPFGKYDLKGIAAKWAGAWVKGGSSLGRTAAWNVADGKVTIVEGDKEETLDFEILAPCYAKSTNKAEGSSTYHKFAFDGDTLYAGLGNAGVVTDDGAVACISASVYELTGDGCKKWDSRFDEWKSEDAECSLADGVFTAGSSKLDVVGEALVNQQMKGNKAEKHDSFDAAKAALAEKK